MAVTRSRLVSGYPYVYQNENKWLGVKGGGFGGWK